MNSTTDTFGSLVLQDVKEPHATNADQLSVLHTDLRMWMDELKTLKDDVEVQLAAYKSKLTALRSKFESNPEFTYADFLDEKSSLESWRVGAIRFKVSVEKKMRYVTGLMRQERQHQESV